MSIYSGVLFSMLGILIILNIYLYFSIHKKLVPRSSLFETCVSCNDITNTPITLPVDERVHYIEGAGQLCAYCYTLLYRTNTFAQTNNI